MSEERLEIWNLKPSKRILLRKLTLNIRLIIGMSIIGFELFDNFVVAFSNQDSAIDFILSFIDERNTFFAIITIILTIIFFYLALLLVTNIFAIIWGLLNYITMDTFIDTKSVHIKKGVIFKQELEIPIHRLTDVQVQIHVFDRILNTADVHCNTAGGVTNYVIETLHQEDAYKIRNYLQKQMGDIDERLENIPKHYLEDPRIQTELKEIRELMIEVFG